MKQKGYTLLELVIVITISIILFASTAVVIGDQIEGNKIRSTGIKIEALTQALENYRIKHHALPCPALLTDAEGSSSYGVAATECANTCPSGMTCNTNFVTGAVPTVDLELGNSIAIDDWDSKIVYSIDRRFTQEGVCQVDGALTVNNTEGGVTNTLSSTAAYVLVSFGKDGFGAYSTGGALKASCASGMLQTENCNNDYIFTTAYINKPVDATIYYDDIVGWSPNTQRIKCPAGVVDCQLWLDAADICSINYNSPSNVVSNWIDKSDNNLEAVGVSNPTFDPAVKFNDYPYISFAGAQLLTVNSATVLPDTNFTEVLVFRTSTNSDAVITAAADGASYTANANRQLGFQSSGKSAFSIISGETINSNARCGTASPYCADGKPHIATITVDSTKGHILYLDGVVDASSPTATTSLSGQSHMLVGGHTSWGYYTGDLMEVLVYNRVLTLNELKTLEVYLAAKWNVGSYKP
jgi:type II secretory pathway pseudopilin PulG